ncbi:hypothetical protein KSS94_06295 [Pseudomonas fakonensis]|uniref:Uncharacterized protein n=1 Tax=Pseudomonas fakonensis TaxID=2842355 RepID=A0ABX8NA73_9PSED|nr:hypothetical protein [Pseudomonas fakonensis]QXH52735.1 hypothetical protein KSS94_06295 [Pseudomonas fakonensis]
MTAHTHNAWISRLEYQLMLIAPRKMGLELLAFFQGWHTMNTTFMMETDGSWYLTPAYDVSSYLPGISHISIHGVAQRDGRATVLCWLCRPHRRQAGSYRDHTRF